jgi:hypothetical protein
MDEKMIQKLNSAISAVFIIAAALLFAAALKHRGADKVVTTTPAETATSTSETETSVTPAYDDQASMQQLQVAKDFASWSPEGKLAAEKTRTVSMKVKGQVAKASLNVKASIGGKPLTKYESIFMKFNDNGGHLFRPHSLPTPADESATDLLFDLGAVPVLPTVPYDENRTPTTVDLTSLLKDGKSIKLTAFISSLRPAMFEDLSVSYLCADGSDCSISL